MVDDGNGLSVVNRHLNQSPSGESLIELSKACKIITHVMDPWTLSCIEHVDGEVAFYVP